MNKPPQFSSTLIKQNCEHPKLYKGIVWLKGSIQSNAMPNFQTPGMYTMNSDQTSSFIKI